MTIPLLVHGRPAAASLPIVLACLLVAGPVACDRMPEVEAEVPMEATTAPTNRIDIPDPVRRNLGIRFATVEARSIDSVLRVPGRFELLPDARRDHRAPLDGRVEILVEELQPVTPGTPLFRLSGKGWFALEERIATTETRLKSMEPLRQAHRRHESNLAAQVELWQQRVDQLDELREAGGGNASNATRAMASLIEAKADLAEVMEKDAELNANEGVLRTELSGLRARRDQLRGIASCPDSDGLGLVVCASVEGIIERISATPGTHVAEGDAILVVVQPERIRVRARMLQSDLPLVRDGLQARITAPSAANLETLPPMPATLQIAPVADPDTRTIDLLARPLDLESWARPGIGVSLEVIRAGGIRELAIPEQAIVEEGGMPYLFRRDPADPDLAIRIDADLGRSDGRWVEILSGVAEGDEVVVAGQDQLLLASGERPQTAGHFHADGTFHAEDH